MRINIEDSIYLDERFHRMSAFEGKYKALGLCVAAWTLAHRWWNKHPERLVPLSEWDKDADLILVEKYGLADRRENGIYVKGAEKECKYLTERVEAGRRGGLKSQENKSSKLKQIEQNQPSSSISFSKEKKGERVQRSQATMAPLFFLNLWNENRGSLREAVNINAKRKASCIARLKDNPSQDYWREVITRMANSKFCTGENDRGWRADFDFLLKPDTHLKVMEGKYDDRKEIITQKLKNVLNGDIE